MPATQITQSADETTPAARQPAVVPRHHTEQGIARRYGSQIRETVAEPEGQRPTKDDQDPNLDSPADG